MKIKAAYYLRSLPTKIAVVLPSDEAKITNLTPFRSVREDELTGLAALDIPEYRRHMLKDRIPDYVLPGYGFELCDNMPIRDLSQDH